MSNNSNNNGEMTQKGREALERFKMESASEMGINLKQGYNGDLTSREAGSIGGRMVHMIKPQQQYIFKRNSIKRQHHEFQIRYDAEIYI